MRMNYKGVSCPVCGQEFKEGDDIVVCPECGAHTVVPVINSSVIALCSRSFMKKD